MVEAFCNGMLPIAFQAQLNIQFQALNFLQEIH